MVNALTSEGKWWLPDHNDTKLYGTISFNEETGGSLLLAGSEARRLPHEEKIRDGAVVLLGELIDKRKITISARMSNRSEPMEINPLTGQLRYYQITYDFDIDFVFLGHHFNRVEEIQFEEIVVKYSHINAWIHDPEMNGFLSKKREKDRINIEYFFGKQVEVKIEDGTVIWIYNNIEAHGKGLLTDLELNRDLYVKIRAKQRTFDEYIELKNKIQDFFNFFIDRNVLTESFKGLVPLDNHGHKDMKEITVLYHSRISKKMRKTGMIRPFLFHYDEISGLFVSLVKRWFKLREKENVVLDNYFGVMYNPGLFTENILLMLSGALEAYHTDYRKKLSESAQTRKERTKRIMSIVNELSISEEDKNWISGAISNRSFPSFEERIEEVYDDHGEIAAKFLHTKDKEIFGSKINRYRNGISHANKNFQKESEELFRSTIDLQILVQLCILNMLELPSELVKKRFLHKGFLR